MLDLPRLELEDGSVAGGSFGGGVSFAGGSFGGGGSVTGGSFGTGILFAGGSFPDQVAGGGWLGGAVLDGTGGPARDAGAAILSGLLDALV
ncbi:hypothetical protein ABVK25_010535 [Lepraria finkii]|uniref:Uncharacterized protein n=1 Tax=Lepraria finkii TaxID=1340010 RepID=A0ABR4AV76_9LECA